MNENQAFLALEDGRVFEGRSFGARGERTGEVVFNTSMTGYQEILTDPSYKGQIVTMTYPLIGNYGVNPEDVESRQPFVEGFVVRECSRITSNWRARGGLADYLRDHGIVGIEGIDTRALTRHLRIHGAQKAVISTEDSAAASLVEKARRAPGLVGRDLVKEVTCAKPYEWNRRPEIAKKFRVVAFDFGIKHNILRILEEVGCAVTVVPAFATAREVMALKPDGIFLSNGPGDPEGIPYAIAQIRELLGQKPIFGICLGHQLLGLAMGGKTYKLKFGHHGANHPVVDTRTNRIGITSQNHGFCVDVETLDRSRIEITHINLNDRTVEGMRRRDIPVFSVQHHPEASPGPHESRYLFDLFVDLMSGRK